MSINEEAASTYLDTVGALTAIMNSLHASEAEKAKADAALTALNAAWKDGVRADFAGRSAQYNLLARRLNEVTAGIVTNPLSPIRDRLNGFIDDVKATLVEEAKAIAAPGGPAPTAAEAEAEALAAGRAQGRGDGQAPPAADPVDPAPARPPLPPALVDAPRPAGSPVPAALYQEYATLFATCLLRPEGSGTLGQTVARLRAGKARYDAVAGATGVPWWVIGLIHGLECGYKFDRHLHNGDPLAARTVRVPNGRPAAGDPPFAWEDSAGDALQHDGFVGWADWSLPAVLYKLERYNGWGYRKFHPDVLSPYLWSFTTHYSKGKYVADGRFDPEAVSKQVGAAAILRAMVNAGALA